MAEPNVRVETAELFVHNLGGEAGNTNFPDIFRKEEIDSAFASFARHARVGNDCRLVLHLDNGKELVFSSCSLVRCSALRKSSMASSASVEAVEAGGGDSNPGSDSVDGCSEEKAAIQRILSRCSILTSNSSGASSSPSSSFKAASVSFTSCTEEARSPKGRVGPEGTGELLSRFCTTLCKRVRICGRWLNQGEKIASLSLQSKIALARKIDCCTNSSKIPLTCGFRTKNPGRIQRCRGESSPAKRRNSTLRTSASSHDLAMRSV